MLSEQTFRKRTSMPLQTQLPVKVFSTGEEHNYINTYIGGFTSGWNKQDMPLV